MDDGGPQVIAPLTRDEPRFVLSSILSGYVFAPRLFEVLVDFVRDGFRDTGHGKGCERAFRVFR